MQVKKQKNRAIFIALFEIGLNQISQHSKQLPVRS